MKAKTVVITAGVGILLSVAGVALSGVSAFGQVYRDVEIGSVEKIQTITAGPDGTAWGLTSSGRLFYCKAVNTPATHIACFDEKGPVNANFHR
jgi:hypothetical protein